jgi:hypothetical protein
MMRRPAILLLWIAGMLFPMAWLTRFSAIYSRLFERVFNPLWVHVLMHAFLFAVLAYLLIRQRAGHAVAARRWRTAVLALGLVLAMAVAQEGIQLLYKARPVGADEVLDIGIDLAGGVFGMLVGGLK